MKLGYNYENDHRINNSYLVKSGLIGEQLEYLEVRVK